MVKSIVTTHDDGADCGDDELPALDSSALSAALADLLLSALDAQSTQSEDDES